MIKEATPYLVFEGTAEKAIHHYERALGAKVEGLIRFGEVQGMPCPESAKNGVMHALLKLGSAKVMLSDGQPGKPVSKGESCQVAIEIDDPDVVKRFDALGAGGHVEMPPQATFWAKKFGMLTDAFGIRWILNCPSPDQRPNK